MQTEDGQIIHECLNGDPAEFGLLVDKYKEGIYALAYSKLGNFHDAQDITQETFIKAYTKLRTLKYWDSFAMWLGAIANNLCRQLIRSRSRRPDRDFAEDNPPEIIDMISIKSYQDNSIYQSLNDALESLPETYRQVLVLHYLSGMKSMEIARMLGVSLRTVTERLRMGREKLREEMVAMMGATFREQKLPAGFTFRIVESVKRIRIHPVSTTKGLPWALSIATGIMATIMIINPATVHFNEVETPIFAPLPAEIKVLKVGEIPVDVVNTSNISILSSNMGKGKGGGPKQPEIENAFFMAPQGEGGTWAKKADMPTARNNLSTSAVDGIIYAIGGWDGSSFFPTVEAYDPKTDKWTKKKDMPTARMGLSTSVVDGIIYAIGGWIRPGCISTVEAYNPKTDTWTKKADMPTKRDWFSISVVDGIIYAVGGWNEAGFFSAVEAYDPKMDTWTKKTNMLTPRYSLSTGMVNGIIYAIGGQGGGKGNTINFTTVEAYNPEIDTWAKKSDMLTERMELKVSVVNGEIYAIGGWIGEDAQPCSIVEKYNPITDTWTMKSEMPTNRGFHSISVVNGKIYAIGGGTAWNVAFNEGVVEEYTPEGWPFGISPQGKLPTEWGKIKS